MAWLEIQHFRTLVSRAERPPLPSLRVGNPHSAFLGPEDRSIARHGIGSAACPAPPSRGWPFHCSADQPPFRPKRRRRV